MYLAQERVEFTVHKAPGLSVQVGKLCGLRQVHGIGRSVYLFFSVLSRVRVSETRVLLLYTVSDPISNYRKELASHIQAMGARRLYSTLSGHTSVWNKERSGDTGGNIEILHAQRKGRSTKACTTLKAHNLKQQKSFNI